MGGKYRLSNHNNSNSNSNSQNGNSSSNKRKRKRERKRFLQQQQDEDEEETTLLAAASSPAHRLLDMESNNNNHNDNNNETGSSSGGAGGGGDHENNREKEQQQQQQQHEQLHKTSSKKQQHPHHAHHHHPSRDDPLESGLVTKSSSGSGSGSSNKKEHKKYKSESAADAGGIIQKEKGEKHEHPQPSANAALLFVGGSLAERTFTTSTTTTTTTRENNHDKDGDNMTSSSSTPDTKLSASSLSPLLGGKHLPETTRTKGEKKNNSSSSDKKKLNKKDKKDSKLPPSSFHPQNQQQQQQPHQLSRQKNGCVVPASNLQQQVQQHSKNNSLNAATSIFSRKRALSKVDFVYPKQQQQAQQEQQSQRTSSTSATAHTTTTTMQNPIYFAFQSAIDSEQQQQATTQPTNHATKGVSEQATTTTKAAATTQNTETLEDILFRKTSKKTVDKKQLQPSLSNRDESIGSSNETKEPLQNAIAKDTDTDRKNSKNKESLQDEQEKKKEKKHLKKSAVAFQLETPPPPPPVDAAAVAAMGRLSGLSVEEAVRDKHGCRPRANSTDGELNLPRRGLCDEGKVLESYKWHSNSSSNEPPRGLVNLGNTCFLNSTLQCLAYIPPLYQSLLNMPEPNSQDLQPQSQSHANQSKAAAKSSKMSQGKRITYMLRSLFREMHGGKGSNGGSSRAIAPHAIVKAVPSLGSCGSRKHSGSYKFRPGRQEDAHEFLVHLLDAMNDGELRQAGINQHVSGWREHLPVPRLDETTFIHRIFGGYLRSQVRCTSCGHCSNTYDPFLDLSLEVSRKQCHTISNALAEFTRKETLDSENRWKCSGCKKRVCATKQLTVFRPPLSLCIQLKRFSYHHHHGSSSGGGKFSFLSHGGGKKITKPIDFPEILKLPLSDKRSCGYELTGVVIHVGGSASSGHYTAFVKKPSKQWFHMDDSSVRAVSERTVLDQKDAYVLFYCRQEVKLEFPSPPFRTTAMSAEEAKEFGRARARARADSLTILTNEGDKDPYNDSSSMEGMGNNNKDSSTNTASHSADKIPFTPEFSNPNGGDSNAKKVKGAASLPLHDDDDESSSSSGSSSSSSDTFEAPRVLSTTAAAGQGAMKISASQKKKHKTVLSPDMHDDEDDAHGAKKSSQHRLGIQPFAIGNDNNDSFGIPMEPKKKSPPIAASTTTADANVAKPLLTTAESVFALRLEAIDEASKEEDEDEEDKEGSDSSSESAKEKSAQNVPKARATKTSADSESDGELPVDNNTASATSSSASDDESEKEVSLEGQLVPAASSEAPSTDSQGTSRLAEQAPSSAHEDDSSSSSSSTTSSSSSSDDSSNGSSSDEAPPASAKNATPQDDLEKIAVRSKQVTKKEKTRVVLDRGEGQGKVEVVLGQRSKANAWKPQVPARTQDEGFELLGNLRVDKWDTQESEDSDNGSGVRPKSSTATMVPKHEADVRAKIFEQMHKQEKSKKRKMFLDRWDAMLDQGKKKKVKNASTATNSAATANSDPKKNAFQLIHSSIQRMNQGKPKGFHAHHTNKKDRPKRR